MALRHFIIVAGAAAFSCAPMVPVAAQQQARAYLDTAGKAQSAIGTFCVPAADGSGCPTGGSGTGGSGGPTTIANGADTAEGNTSDAAYANATGANAASLIALNKGAFVQLYNLNTAVAGLLKSGGSVSVSNFPATQAISGTVSVGNFPTSQAVTGAFYQATQPVSGSVSVSNFPATQPVSGTFYQATQPVSGTVSVGNFPATQAISGSITANIGTTNGLALDSTVGALFKAGQGVVINSGAVTATVSNGFFGARLQDASGNALGTMTNPVYGGTFDTFSAPAAFAATVGTAYTINLGRGQGVADFSITGLVASGAVLSFTYSDDNGVNFYPIRNVANSTAPGATSVATDGAISITAAGHTQLRLTVTTAGTGNIMIGSNVSAPVRAVNIEGTGTSASNPLFVRILKSATNGSTTVTAATASTLLLAANPARNGCNVLNNSTAVMYLRLSTASTPTTYDYYLAGSVNGVPASFACPSDWQGVVYAAWATAAGNALVSERTP